MGVVLESLVHFKMENYEDKKMEYESLLLEFEL
jgi:hypothetical protein